MPVLINYSEHNNIKVDWKGILSPRKSHTELNWANMLNTIQCSYDTFKFVYFEIKSTGNSVLVFSLSLISSFQHDFVTIKNPHGSMAMSAEHRSKLKPFTCPYERKTLEWDDKPHPKK